MAYKRKVIYSKDLSFLNVDDKTFQTTLVQIRLLTDDDYKDKKLQGFDYELIFFNLKNEKLIPVYVTRDNFNRLLNTDIDMITFHASLDAEKRSLLDLNKQPEEIKEYLENKDKALVKFHANENKQPDLSK